MALRSFSKEDQIQFTNDTGLSLLALVGLLGIVTIGLTVFSPSFVAIWERQHQEEEVNHLQFIAEGITTYLRQNKMFPPSLVSLSPDFVPLGQGQISINSKGYPRYYSIHPNMTGFQNSTGLTAGALPDVRFLLLSDLDQDLAPTITSPGDFDAWWNLDESTIPSLKIYRGNLGHHFVSLNIVPEGNGASYFIHTLPATDSGGELLPAHGAFHLIGTEIGFEEDDFYGTPSEVFFALTTDTTYWFDPFCPPGKKWNPLDPICGGNITVRDEFLAIAFNGNDGPQNWSNTWQETGEADGPSSGKMQVVSDAHCQIGNCFRFGGGGGGPSTEVSREVDLSTTTSATLTFTYRRNDDQNGGTIKLEISNDGGTSWTTLQTYAMNGIDPIPIPQSFDVSAYISSNTQIRFVRTGNLTRFFFADNIQIQGT